MKFYKQLAINISICVSAMCIGFTLNAAPSSNIDGAYLNMGAGYVQNLAKADASAVSTKGIIQDQDYLYQNIKHLKGFAIHIGAGYRWRLNDNWSWILGARLSRDALGTQKGTWEDVPFDGGEEPYSYAINATDLSLVGHIIYNIGKWQSHIGVQVGMDRIVSDSFADPEGTEILSKAVNHASYGDEIGIMRFVYRYTSVGINLNYSVLGKAKLGSQVADVISSSSRNVQQTLHVMTTSLDFVHWF